MNNESNNNNNNNESNNNNRNDENEDLEIVIPDLMELVDEDAEMEQAFLRISDFEKREYLQALEQVPHLVESESPWEDFLWTEDNNTHKAALRLARYWKARLFLFGKDHWLRPLNQTGSGALFAQDIANLQSGFFVINVRPSGGIVAVVDLAKLPVCSERSVDRIYFYLSSIYAKPARQGYHYVNIETGKMAPTASTEDSQAIMMVSIPIKLAMCKMYVVQACFEPGREVLLDYATYQGQQILKFNTKNNSVQRILGNSVKQALVSIQQASGGIERQCLPLSIGGTYDYSMYDEWIQSRLKREFFQVPVQTFTMSFATTTTACVKGRVLAVSDTSDMDEDHHDGEEEDSATLSSSSRNSKKSLVKTTRLPQQLIVCPPPQLLAMHPAQDEKGEVGKKNIAQYPCI